MHGFIPNLKVSAILHFAFSFSRIVKIDEIQAFFCSFLPDMSISILAIVLRLFPS